MSTATASQTAELWKYVLYTNIFSLFFSYSRLSLYQFIFDTEPLV